MSCMRWAWETFHDSARVCRQNEFYWRIQPTSKAMQYMRWKGGIVGITIKEKQMSEKKEKQKRKTRAEFIAEHKRMVEDLQKYEAQLNRMVQIVGTIVSHGHTSNLPYALSLSKVEKFNGALDLSIVREQDLLTIQVSYNANV